MNQREPDPCASPSHGVDCATVLQQLWEYLDAELGPETMQAFRTHLALCSHCYPHYDFEKAFLEAIASCRCTTCAPNDVRCHVLDALRHAGFTPTDSHAVS